MRITVRHIGFVRGKPRRYRHVGEMPVFMDTSCDIPEVGLEETSLAAELVDPQSGVATQFRRIEHRYVRPVPTGAALLDVARRQVVNLDAFPGSTGVDYRHNAGWRTFASRCIGSSVDPRELHDWDAREIDASDSSAFSDAVREVMARFVLIDGRLWEECFEPCMLVTWRHIEDGGVRGMVHPGDSGAFYAPPGVDTHDESGLRVMRPTVLNYFSASPIKHERCFSLNELSRIPDFTESLGGRFASAPERYVSVDTSLLSRDFDNLELGRTARLHMASWMSMERELTKATKNKWKKSISGQELDSRSLEVETALREFENNEGPPDDLLDAINSMASGLRLLVGVAKRRLGLDLSEWMAPAYYGDPDNMSVIIDIAAESPKFGS